MLTGACGLAAAGRLRRGGRSLAATFVIGESLPLEGAELPGAAVRRVGQAAPRGCREVRVGVLGPARALDSAAERRPWRVT